MAISHEPRNKIGVNLRQVGMKTQQTGKGSCVFQTKVATLQVTEPLPGIRGKAFMSWCLLSS